MKYEFFLSMPQSVWVISSSNELMLHIRCRYTCESVGALWKWFFFWKMIFFIDAHTHSNWRVHTHTHTHTHAHLFFVNVICCFLLLLLATPTHNTKLANIYSLHFWVEKNVLLVHLRHVTPVTVVLWDSFTLSFFKAGWKCQRWLILNLEKQVILI